MAQQERFEVKKPDNGDHKGINRAADVAKQVLTFGGLTVAIVKTIQVYGPKVVKIITKK